MSRYIIHTNGKGCEIDIPGGLSSEQWGQIHEAFAKQYGKRGSMSVSFVKHDTQQVINGVFYDWGLAGPDGAWYDVFWWPEHSPGDVADAVSKLRRDQDVVRLNVITLKRVEFALPIYTDVSATGAQP